MQPVKAPPIKAPDDTIVAKLHIWVNDFFIQIPNLVAALALLLVAWGIAKLVSWAIQRYTDRHDQVDLGNLLGSIAYVIILLLGVMIAAAIVFPSVQPGNIFATLGIGSVAVGFAFKDILQNLFAGILLLTNRPFRRGDQIEIKEYQGTVEHIQSRATLIRTYDGRRVIIPNADIYTSPVTVGTAFPRRRDQLEFGIGYNEDLDHVGRLVVETIRGIEGVLDDPAPEVLALEIREGDILMRARWWAGSKRKETIHVRARIVPALLEAFRTNGIDLPFPSQVVLLHDRTGVDEGDRFEQRTRSVGEVAAPDPDPVPPRLTEPH